MFSVLQVDGQRHLVMATDEQLHILQQAKKWYIDKTAYVVRRPFHQLFSIHAFVRKGDSAKQVPLMYALMSARRAVDYRAVLRTLLNQLPSPPRVQEVAMWVAARHEL